MKRAVLAYVSDPRSVGIRAALTIAVTTLVVVFSLPEFVNGRHSWFLGTEDVTWPHVGQPLVPGLWLRLSNCVPRVYPGQTGYRIGNHAGAASSLFFFLVPIWGVVFDRRAAYEIVLAWSHFTVLAVTSFMYHGTRFDEYWRIDRALCYLFVVPFLVLEAFERVPASGHFAKLGLLGIYTLSVVLFSTRDDYFDEAGDITTYVTLGLYTCLVALRLLRGDRVRVAYVAGGLVVLLFSFLLLTDSAFEFCHGHAWLGNLAVGHLVAVPGFALLLASHFLRFGRGPQPRPEDATPLTLVIDGLFY